MSNFIEIRMHCGSRFCNVTILTSVPEMGKNRLKQIFVPRNLSFEQNENRRDTCCDLERIDNDPNPRGFCWDDSWSLKYDP